MKTVITIAVLIWATAGISEAKPISLTVNGLGLGASYNAVIRKFGKPARTVNAAGDICVGGRSRTLYYPGLKFELHDGEPGTFTVSTFEVTSVKWDVSGYKVGMPIATIKSRYGNFHTEEPGKRGERWWYYEIGEDGGESANFYFRNGKVYKIQTSYLMC